MSNLSYHTIRQDAAGLLRQRKYTLPDQTQYIIVLQTCADIGCFSCAAIEGDLKE